jgi:hypothetical protein
MDALMVVVCLVAIVLGYRLIRVALYQKGDFKAGARVGPTSFFVEVHDKKSSSAEVPSRRINANR